MDSSVLAGYKADALALYFDTEGLKDKVANHPKNKKGVVDEAIWTKVLDSEIRNGIISAAHRRYVNGRNVNGVIDPVFSLMAYQSIYDFISTGDGMLWATLAVGFKTIQLYSQAHTVNRSGNSFSDVNWSTQVFTNVRTDRLIATAVSSKLGGKTLKLAK